MLVKLLVLSTFGLASSQTGSQPVFSPVFQPASVGSPTSPPVYIAESLGPTTGKSCLARVGPICTFVDPECCTATRSYSFYIPGLATQVPCYGAKARYNSTLSAAFTDAQCNATRSSIEVNGGVSCSCASAPTPAPKLSGSCISRPNGTAFKPCDFLPAGRTPEGCCPMKEDPAYIRNIDTSISDESWWSCGFVNRTLHSNKSSAWPDSLCFEMKKAVEDQAYRVDGCVCPGSDKLNTTPPTPAPFIPSASPTLRPTASNALSPVATGAAVLALLAVGVFL